jgi:hypothetical protein
MKRNSLVRAGVAAALLFAGAAYAGELTIFTAPKFGGKEMTIRGAVSNLDRTGFNDSAESLSVRGGRWEVCTDAYFSGHCEVVGPGEYARLRGPLFRRISSARELMPYAYEEPRFYRYGAYERYAPIERRYSAVEAYTLPGFRGDTLRIEGNATSIAPSDSVSSLVIREGVWEACTGVDFNGACRVYEPGHYANLGSLDGRIASLRRIG